MTDAGRILTRRALIRGVAARWSAQYDERYCAHDPDKKRIRDALKAIDGDTASADDVNAIIGDSSWTRLWCDICSEESEELLRIGDEPDYEARFVDLCADCLRKGVSQIEAALNLTRGK